MGESIIFSFENKVVLVFCVIYGFIGKRKKELKLFLIFIFFTCGIMETNKLFVGGISWNLSWQDLKDAFNEHAEVVHAKIIMDRETNKSRGFGFVEFATVEEAVKAKEAMDGAELDGRTIKVDYAQEREQA